MKKEKQNISAGSIPGLTMTSRPIESLHDGRDKSATLKHIRLSTEIIYNRNLELPHPIHPRKYPRTETLSLRHHWDLWSQIDWFWRKTTQSGHKICFSGDEKKRGVAFIVRKEIKHSVIRFNPIFSRHFHPCVSQTIQHEHHLGLCFKIRTLWCGSWGILRIIWIYREKIPPKRHHARGLEC